MPVELMNSSLWWHGPSWLLRDSKQWPLHTVQIDQKVIPEKRNIKLALSTVEQNFDIFERYSSLKKLIKVTAWCLRYINIKLKRKGSIVDKYLSISELENAENILLKLAQRQQFNEEIIALQNGQNIKRNSIILSLNPFVDEFGILRVGGRLKHGI